MILSQLELAALVIGDQILYQQTMMVLSRSVLC